ncbi:cuticle protein 16.5-like [Anthonomus grandis grandis]|uniref:cuticle protein 16.5-like n=1 Tax=Anthonomus grandis grandis TaxID=2921223 RepID=UPI002166AC68|nr:cuticle protein 16.5-like [Anthonomus grandis grandis]
MASNTLFIAFFATLAISGCMGGPDASVAVPAAAIPAAYSVPYASSYSANVINHAIAAPVAAVAPARLAAAPVAAVAAPVAAPFVARSAPLIAPASPFAAPYFAAPAPYFASPYAAVAPAPLVVAK